MKLIDQINGTFTIRRLRLVSVSTSYHNINSKAELDLAVLGKTFDNEYIALIPINKLQIKFESKEVRLDLTVVDRDGNAKEMMSLYCEEIQTAVMFLKSFYKIQHYYKTHFFGHQQGSVASAINSSTPGISPTIQ